MMILAVIAVLLAALVAANIVAWQKPSTSQLPSVAVLPFANLSGDPGQDYFADGITDDLITDLAKLSGLDVIGHNSVFAYKGKSIVLADLGRDLGVRYVVEGSARRTGEQIRLNVQLIDVATGDNLWANRFDRGIADVFDVQEEMTREIAKALGVQPSRAESERVARPPTANLEAYDYYLRAEQAARNGGRSKLREALSLYDKAVALDPAFAEAFAADARTAVYIWRGSLHSVLQSAPARKRAYEKASRALELDPNLSSPYAILGIMQVVNRRYEEAIASAQRAVTLEPRDAETQIALAYVQLFAGNHEEAGTAVDTALRLDPNLSASDREVAGLVFLLQDKIPEAIETLERARADAPAVGVFRITLAMAYARAGRLSEAHASIADGLHLIPSLDSLAAWRIHFAHFRNPQDLDFIISSLRKAGLPEWPYSFTADDSDRLKGHEIDALVTGHMLQGELDPGHQPAIMQIGRDGKAAFRSPVQMITETVYVNGDMLCEQSESMFGLPLCGPVYKRIGASSGYSYVNASKVFHFTVK